MFGKLLSTTLKIVTCPIDICEIALDVLSGGDGSKKSKDMADSPFSGIRDGICKGLEDLDKD
jgi:hypothetical protein